MSSVAAAGPQEERSTTIRILAVLLLLLTFFAWDRSVLAVSLPEIRQSLGLGPSQTGLIATAFTLGLALVAVPTGLMVRRFGFRPTLVGGSLLFSCATFYPPLAQGYADLLVSRILVGVGEGVFHVALLLYLASLTQKHRAALVGAAATVYGLASSLGPSSIQAFNGAVGDWHMSFYALAAIGVLLCILLMLFIAPSKPNDTAADAAAAEQVGVDWGAIAKFWPLLVLVGVQGLAVYSVSGLLPAWTRTNFGFTPAQGALVLGTFGFGAMFGGAPMGFVADMFPRKGYMLTMGVVSGLAATAVMGFHHSLPYSLSAAFVFGLMAHSIYVTAIAYAQESGKHDAAVLVGWIVTVFYGCASISGFVMMAVAQRLGFQNAAIVTYGALYAVGVVAFLLFHKKRPAAPAA